MSATTRMTVAELFARFSRELELRWLGDRAGGERELTRRSAAMARPRLLGPINYNSANRIQLLGPSECRLMGNGVVLDESRFEYPLSEDSELFIISDGHAVPPSILEFGRRHDIGVMVSTLPYSRLQKELRFHLGRQLSGWETMHGVLMDVHGTGVLITGNARVGKSELALELVTRGHILVADDAPEFSRIAPGTIEGRCPPLLQDFLEVRGLGVLNIARMYGDAHTRSRKVLRFIVHLYSAETDAQSNARLDTHPFDEPEIERELLGVRIPERAIPVAPGRNIAVLVEAAVRDYILRSGGYSATRDLVRKQADVIASQEAEIS